MLVVKVTVNEGDVVVVEISNTVEKPSVEVITVSVTVFVSVVVVRPVRVVVEVTKVSPTVLVIDVLSEVVLTVVGVGVKKVTEPVKIVGLVTVMRVGMKIVGEKAVMVENTIVVTDDFVCVEMMVVVRVPVTVVTSSTLKMKGLRTVKIKKDVMRKVDGSY